MSVTRQRHNYPGATYVPCLSLALSSSPVFCPADFNQDGFVDGADSDQFGDAFEAGC
jgi:hypothetical protein